MSAVSSACISVATLTAGALVLTLAQQPLLQQQAKNAADNAALAAADTVSGFISGDACENATKVAKEHKMRVKNCEIDDLTAVISVYSENFLPKIQAIARAGQ